MLFLTLLRLTISSFTLSGDWWTVEEGVFIGDPESNHTKEDVGKDT